MTYTCKSMKPTSIWTEVKLDVGRIEKTRMNNESELEFCIGDTQYTFSMDDDSYWSETLGTSFSVERPGKPDRDLTLEEFNILSGQHRYDSIQVDETTEDDVENNHPGENKFVCTIRFTKHSHNLVVEFYNIHNGYYAHPVSLKENNNNIIFKTYI